MARRENSKANPWIISYGRTDYDGSAIDSLTPIHKAQQIHKYRLGLRVVGIIAIAIALINIILIALHMVNIYKGIEKDPIAPAITALSMGFLITLLIDIIFTVNLNRYINDKKPLILYIPCAAIMLVFSVPQLIAVIAIFGINVPQDVTNFFANLSWANYVSILVCLVYLVAEPIRIYYRRQDLSLKQEIKKALE